MDPTPFTPVPALIGGALIGLATGLALLLNGKIAGISGVVGRVLRPAPGDAAWRVTFLIGMIGGGALTFALYPPAAEFQSWGNAGTMVLAGVLVGFGSRYGGGCTSGHGVCGIARGSTGGITGTVTFMAIAIVTVAILRRGLGW